MAAVIILPLLRHVVGATAVDTEHDIVRGLLLLVCNVIVFRVVVMRKNFMFSS